MFDFFFFSALYGLLDFQKKTGAACIKQARAERQLLKFFLNHLCCSAPCRAVPCHAALAFARPDKARRINIFYLSVAAASRMVSGAVRLCKVELRKRCSSSSSSNAGRWRAEDRSDLTINS